MKLDLLDIIGISNPAIPGYSELLLSLHLLIKVGISDPVTPGYSKHE